MARQWSEFPVPRDLPFCPMLGTKGARFLFHRPMTRRPDSVRSAARGISAGVNSRGTRGTRFSTLGVDVLSRRDSGSPSPGPAWFSPISLGSPRCRLSSSNASIGPSLPEDRPLAITGFPARGCATQAGAVDFSPRQSTDNGVITCVTIGTGRATCFRGNTGCSAAPLPYGPACSPMREQSMERSAVTNRRAAPGGRVLHRTAWSSTFAAAVANPPRPAGSVAKHA